MFPFVDFFFFFFFFFQLDRDFYEDIMRGPLKCNKCQEEFKTLPKLKFHANKCGMEEPMTEPSGGGNFADEPPVQQ